MNPAEFYKCECRHCRGHIEFPSDARGQSVNCPHCGQLTELNDQTKKRSQFALIITAGLTTLLVATALCFIFKPAGKPVVQKINFPVATNFPAAQKVSDNIGVNDFFISAVKLTKTANSTLVYVTGQVRNLAAQKRFGVKVEFALTTTNGTSAGKASDYAPALDAKADWNFKALVLDSKAADVKFSSITETK